MLKLTDQPKLFDHIVVYKKSVERMRMISSINSILKEGIILVAKLQRKMIKIGLDKVLESQQNTLTNLHSTRIQMLSCMRLEWEYHCLKAR